MPFLGSIFPKDIQKNIIIPHTNKITKNIHKKLKSHILKLTYLGKGV